MWSDNVISVMATLLLVMRVELLKQQKCISSLLYITTLISEDHVHTNCEKCIIQWYPPVEET